jgi:hypothetical protein
MAKNFPYFKFFPTEWMTGDIVFEDFETQGLFINICALYWQRNADLSIEDINKRFKYPSKLANLTDRFFSLSEDKILIKFLDEQLVDAGHISKTNSLNGSKGGRPKGAKTLSKKPTANRPQSETKAKKSKEEEEKEKEKEINITYEEFLNYAKTIDIYKPTLDYAIKSKYLSWVENNWFDGNGKKIINWKSTLRNTMPYLKNLSIPVEETETERKMREWRERGF